jgi:phosphate/sulfate permease
MTEIKKSILAGLGFGLLFGLFQAISYDINHALIVGPISGLFFGIAIYFFVTSKIVKRQTQIENSDDKPIVRSDGANHFVRGEAVGGKLYLLTDKLQFQSHNLNVQNHKLTIDIARIKDVDFYNTLGLIPNGLTITTSDGKKERFVVDNRKLWKEEIETQKKCTAYN